MFVRLPALTPVVLVLVLVLAPSASAQIFVRDDAALPSQPFSNDSDSDGLDFADVDLDGDWDVAFADGGDDGNDQNRLWINRGGLQGGTIGTFDDESLLRLPNVEDSSRDVDFADLDGDHDPDLYVSNHSTVTNQSSRIQINMGGAQGGTLGFFQDETQSRFVGLGQSGSSVAQGLVLAGGGFIDWTSDANFADLDLDGDLDLVHTSYSIGYSGKTPTRLFLNDGDGRFAEFNPSGFQLPGSMIADGDPALWAEGVYLDGTTDTTGTTADIATDLVHGELFDGDQDGDIDLLLGARQGQPRYFENRLETGALIFRDVSSAVLPAGSIASAGKYDQELGDMDGDLDLDLYGLNYGSFIDRVYRNDGGAGFTLVGTVAGSDPDEEQADFLDFDNDGDLDVYTANFSGVDRLYENGPGSAVFGLTLVPSNVSGLGAGNATARAADVCDVDNDGDDDVLVANSNIGPLSNELFRNTIDTPDTWAPTLAWTKVLADAAAAPGGRTVHTSVFDNAPLYSTAWQRTWFELRVDGVGLGPIDATWAGGQVFRAALPGNLVGQVIYQPRSQDPYGNVGVGGVQTFAGFGSHGTAFGSATPSTAGTPSLTALSVPFGGTDLILGSSGVQPGSTGFFALATTALAAPLDLGDGLLANVAGVFDLGIETADLNGTDHRTIPVPPGLPSGALVHAQYIALDGAGGATFASSNGLTVALP